MSTHHHLSIDPPTISTVISSPHGNTSNGQFSVTTHNKIYPPASAEYEQVVQNADLFWEKLQAVHDSLGTKLSVPTVGGKALDLHCLFVEVTSRGGIEKVIRDRKWKEVIIVFNFPTTITSASFVLRKYYLSLLYHFEQIYYFHKEVSPIFLPDPVSRDPVNGSVNQREGSAIKQLSKQGIPKLQLGTSVMGIIDGKFDSGYLITVHLGSDQLKGVLYHTSTEPSRRSRKRSRLGLRDPSRPKSNRSGYNFFFAEHYTRLKPQYHGQEKAIGKKIGILWSNLTEAEKQVYQEKGLKDKERYKAEMVEYKSSQDLNTQ